MSKKLNVLKRIIFFLFIIIAFYFLKHYIYDNWEVIKNEKILFKWNFLFFSCISSFLAWWIVAISWKYLIRKLGFSLNLKQSYISITLPQLGKFIPGKVWSIIGIQYYCEKFGIQKNVALYCAILSAVSMLIASAFFSFFYIIYIGKTYLGSYTVVCVVLLFTFGSIIIHPKIFARFMNLFLKVFKKHVDTINLPAKYFAIYMGFQFISCFFLGLSYAFFSMSLINIDINVFFRILFCFISASIIGDIAIFAPSGIGVREGALMILLSKDILPANLLIIVFGGRLWGTMLQLLSVGFAALLNLLLNNQSGKKF